MAGCCGVLRRVRFVRCAGGLGREAVSLLRDGFGGDAGDLSGVRESGVVRGPDKGDRECDTR
jgi:hypothetical protein